MQEEQNVKLNRTFFAKSMPDEFKCVFIKIVQNTPCFPYDEKAFLCDHIHHYEDIGDYARNQLLDVLDDLRLFVITPENNVSG